MLRRRGLLGIAATTALLAGCGDDPPEEKKPIPQAEGDVTEENPLGVKDSAELEVVVYSGGFGGKFATDVVIPAYTKLFPKANVRFSIQDNIQGSVRPRFAGDSIPDVVNNSGPKPLDVPTMIGSGQIADLSDMFAAASVDYPTKTVAETLPPGVIEQGSYNGKPYVLNYAIVTHGLWYSGKLFHDNGWAAPANWADFTALLDRMKASGINGYGYSGVDGAAYQYLTMLTTAAKIGGTTVLDEIDRLADGAWIQPAVRQAAGLWKSISAYLEKGFESQTTAQIQLLHNQGKIGMIPCGSWIKTEQAKTTPPGFDYQVMPVPSPGAGDKLPQNTMYSGPGLSYVVIAKGANPRGGKEFLRQMLSISAAASFTQLYGIPTIIGAMPPQNLTFTYRWPELYPRLADECRDATNELMFGEGTVDHFCARMQRAADTVKRTK